MSSLQQECTHLFTLSLSLSQLVSRGGFVCDVIDTFENPKIQQKRDQSTGVHKDGTKYVCLAFINWVVGGAAMFREDSMMPKLLSIFLSTTERLVGSNRIFKGSFKTI